MSMTLANTVTPTNATDAQFRAWGSMLSARLAAAGWVQTADTGQINWTTVLAAVGVNTSQGYEIWRMADTLQATSPIFMKLEYGSGQAATCPSIWMTIGTSSNGSGGLNGITTVRQQGMCGTATATPIPAYWSGDTNRFVCFWSGSTFSNSFMFSIERTKDSAGNDTAEGLLIICKNNVAFNQVAWNAITGPYTLWEITLGCFGPAQPPYGTSGTQIAIFPVYFHKGIFMNPGMNCFGYYDPTIAMGSTVTFNVYGAPHTYMPVGTTAVNALVFRGGTAANGALMIRFD